MMTNCWGIIVVRMSDLSDLWLLEKDFSLLWTLKGEVWKESAQVEVCPIRRRKIGQNYFDVSVFILLDLGEKIISISETEKVNKLHLWGLLSSYLFLISLMINKTPPRWWESNILCRGGVLSHRCPLSKRRQSTWGWAAWHRSMMCPPRGLRHWTVDDRAAPVCNAPLVFVGRRTVCVSFSLSGLIWAVSHYNNSSLLLFELINCIMSLLLLNLCNFLL